MSGHYHQHTCQCEHEYVAYCKQCRVVYCRDCRQEWVAKTEWIYTNLLYTTPSTYPCRTDTQGTATIPQVLSNPTNPCQHS